MSIEDNLVMVDTQALEPVMPAMPTSSHVPSFAQLSLTGADALKFLQGQLTVAVDRIEVGQTPVDYLPCAIADLKGRIDFGLWVGRTEVDRYVLVTSADCVDALRKHLKKYGAFSKFVLGEPTPIYPTTVTINDAETVCGFSENEADAKPFDWQRLSIATGNYWILEATRGLFQPQSLRLHQRGGIHYDKGCYLGQEVIARVYFRSSPKAFLHRVRGVGDVPMAGAYLDDEHRIQVVNAIAIGVSDAGSSVVNETNAAEGVKTNENSEVEGVEVEGFEALVLARPEHLDGTGLTLLDLPRALQASVARPE